MAAEEPQVYPDLFDKLADESIVNILSFLNAVEISESSFISKRMKKLSCMNEVWSAASTSFWSSYFRCDEWMEEVRLREEAAILQSLPNMSTVRKDFFLQTIQSLTYEVCIFAMSQVLKIGRPLDLHWFEPRYRWLAARCAALPESKRFMCYASRQPQVEGLAFICKMTTVKLFDDGRALVTLLPVARCKFEQVWHESVPGNPDAPQLACARIKELPTTEQGNAARVMSFSNSSGSTHHPMDETFEEEFLKQRLLELINNAVTNEDGTGGLSFAGHTPNVGQLFHLLAMIQRQEELDDSEEYDDEEDDDYDEDEEDDDEGEEEEEGKGAEEADKEEDEIELGKAHVDQVEVKDHKLQERQENNGISHVKRTRR